MSENKSNGDGIKVEPIQIRISSEAEFKAMLGVIRALEGLAAQHGLTMTHIVGLASQAIHELEHKLALAASQSQQREGIAVPDPATAARIIGKAPHG
jgi:hypothetical protein